MRRIPGGNLQVVCRHATPHPRERRSNLAFEVNGPSLSNNLIEGRDRPGKADEREKQIKGSVLWAADKVPVQGDFSPGQGAK